MDVSAAKWLSEMEMEDPSLLYQSHMDFLHDPIPQFTSNLTPQTPNLNPSSFFSTPNLSDSANLDSYSSQTRTEIPAKQQKTDHWNLNTISQKSAPKSIPPSFSNVISFGNHSNMEQEFPKMFIGNIINSSVKSKEEPVSPTDMESLFDYQSVGFVEESKRVNITRSPLQAKDHVIAERKRREKLNQSFLSLSTLLPGLKKLDKATILGNAIQHIKELQQKERVLEEEAMRKNHFYPAFDRVTKSCTSSDDDTSSSVDNFNKDIFPKQDVEVEVRVRDKDVLIRVNCEKENGRMGKIFGEIEKFNMIVINSNAMPFGLTSLAISIVAQVEGTFPTSAKDLANNLRSALRN